jgi:hypothetical protein
MKTITKADIPAIYLYCLDRQDALDEFLIEVNKQEKWERCKPYEDICFEDFVCNSFNWDKTPQGFFYWMNVAEQSTDSII